MGEGRTQSFVRAEDFLGGLKGARDIWEVGHLGGQLSRTYFKFSYSFCPAALAFQGLTVSQGSLFPRKMS